MLDLGHRTLLALCCLALLGGCMAEESPDAEDAVGVVPGGKADGGDYSACELDGVVAMLNEGASAADLMGLGVHTRASRNLESHRDGGDATFGTADDDLFDNIEEVDAVSWVGPVAIRQLVEAVAERCVAPPTEAGASVVFSPQSYADSHITRVAEAIDGATSTIDIAMYSFRDTSILNALGRARDRGVTVRFLFQSANDHRRSPAGSVSTQLEDLGIEVRYINVIMHHKFAIIDGPRTDLAAAETGSLLTGSGNWSHSAATRYDENTLIITGNAELNLRYQREYNRLWDNGRPFEWNEAIPALEAIEIEESDIPDDGNVDAVFTSANFRDYINSRWGPTFSVNPGENEVADRWVSLIAGAQHSIRIASGHLRSRPISEALIAAHEANPNLEILVYLDNQEYLSEWAHDDQVRELELCLEEASTESQQAGCLDRGFLFGTQLHAAGVPVRYKYYAYRWDYSYADQMHHKYMIVDEEILVTGSYNLSDNAEHGTMENVAILQGAPFRAVIDAYLANFDAMWVTGEAEGLYPALMDDIENGTGSSFPIVFESMAIDWDQVTALKAAIRDNCAEINSDAFRRNAASHRYCDR